MDGGYKSYSTGMVNYTSLKPNHDAKTLCKTNSLYDPDNSAMHRSFKRIGTVIQQHVDIFHVETVVDDQVGFFGGRGKSPRRFIRISTLRWTRCTPSL